MKVQFICSIVGLLCGEPIDAQISRDDTMLIVPCSEHGLSAWGANVSGWYFKLIDIETGRCEWVPDEEANRAMAERERHRQELFWALRTRPLTDAEMAEITQYGDTLNIARGQPYQEAEKMRELNDALLQQYRLRASSRP